MIIYADKNIAEVAAGFSDLGDLRLFSPGQIDETILEKTDALVVRSVTKVNGALLGRSKVRFVGSVTAGTNHLESAYLSQRGVVTASAPGCNAVSVSEYMASVLLELSLREKIKREGGRLGIVGFGFVGKEVHRVARALGMETLLNDPPLERAGKAGPVGDQPPFRSLDELMDCDVITIHVPFEKKGQDATENLFNADRLRRIAKGAVLINASRGGIVDETALAGLLQEGRLGGAVLDTWENEPRVNKNLFSLLEFATPHIAGHSWNGKLNGTRMIRTALCRHLGITEPAATYSVSLSAALSAGETKNWGLLDFVKRSYDVNLDDQALREAMEKEEGPGTAPFESLRQHYRLRPEFSDFTLPGSLPEDLTQTLARLGFRPAPTTARLKGTSKNHLQQHPSP